MEAILLIIGIYGGFALIGWLFSKISDWFERRREKIRDQVAKEVLSGLNIETVISSYKNQLAQIKYIKPNPLQGYVDTIKTQLWGKDAVMMNECPKCKEGYLMVRKGKYGKFLACTKYPKCNYTNNIIRAREEYKKSINEQIVDDIRRAYSNL